MFTGLELLLKAKPDKKLPKMTTDKTKTIVFFISGSHRKKNKKETPWSN